MPLSQHLESVLLEKIREIPVVKSSNEGLTSTRWYCPRCASSLYTDGKDYNYRCIECGFELGKLLSLIVEGHPHK